MGDDGFIALLHHTISDIKGTLELVKNNKTTKRQNDKMTNDKTKKQQNDKMTKRQNDKRQNDKTIKIEGDS